MAYTAWTNKHLMEKIKLCLQLESCYSLDYATCWTKLGLTDLYSFDLLFHSFIAYVFICIDIFIPIKYV